MSCSPYSVYFNPRSREGSDLVSCFSSGDIPISIHAPAKGATVRTLEPFLHGTISIHAPAKGATIFIFFRGVYMGISIHAPAKGATIYRLRKKNRISNFNPRSREGSDNISAGSSLILANFNPRSREGSDNLPVAKKKPYQQFQSTLPRRERLPTNTMDIWSTEISIHAPAKGATYHC